MALTAEQKAEKQDMHNRLRREWNARLRERQAVRNALQEGIEAKYRPAATEAEARENEAIAARDAAVAQINAQIAVLQEQAKKVFAEHQELINRAHIAKRNAEAPLFAAKNAVHAEVDKLCPDLAGSAAWSFAVWRDRRKEHENAADHDSRKDSHAAGHAASVDGG